MKKTIILSVITLFTALFACTKEDKESDNTDAKLFDLSKKTDGFVWYKNKSELLTKSTGSAHAYPYLRTRYNSQAATMLTEDGKVKENAQFPEGSLIVKELLDDNSQLARYAILYKSSNNVNADAKGWVWGYIDADGKVSDPASNKGKSCISCHLQSENIDYMLMNKFFK
jgi:hypothetical protein